VRSPNARSARSVLECGGPPPLYWHVTLLLHVRVTLGCGQPGTIRPSGRTVDGFCWQAVPRATAPGDWRTPGRWRRAGRPVCAKRPGVRRASAAVLARDLTIARSHLSRLRETWNSSAKAKRPVGFWTMVGRPCAGPQRQRTGALKTFSLRLRRAASSSPGCPRKKLFTFFSWTAFVQLNLPGWWRYETIKNSIKQPRYETR
jgi:hypothetical protein